LAHFGSDVALTQTEVAQKRALEKCHSINTIDGLTHTEPARPGDRRSGQRSRWAWATACAASQADAYRYAMPPTWVWVRVLQLVLDARACDGGSESRRRCGALHPVIAHNINH
jgi:hypothetical protein